LNFINESDEMRAFCPSKNTPEKDIVMTPGWLSKEIIDHFSPNGLILDPCRGEGSFYDNFDTESKDWCELEEGIDFLKYDKKVDWIITNPPWSKMQQFLAHGMKVADNIVYLTTINHYTTKNRIRDMRENNFAIKQIYCVPTPKKPWPQLGFQLGAIHTKRWYTGDIIMSYSPNL
jgi:hypothetical protein